MRMTGISDHCSRRNEHPGYTGEEEFNFFLSVLFPESELKILDYNRVVKDLNGMTEDAFLQKIEEIFEVSELIAKDKHPQEKETFSMYLKERWYTCKVRPEDQSEDPVKGLDVSLLQNLIRNYQDRIDLLQQELGQYKSE